MDYLFSALSARLDPGSPQGKSRLAELLFPLVAAIEDPFQQDHYFQRLLASWGSMKQRWKLAWDAPNLGVHLIQRGAANHPEEAAFGPMKRRALQLDQPPLRGWTMIPWRSIV